MSHLERHYKTSNFGMIAGVIVAAMIVTALGCWYIATLQKEQDLAMAELSKAVVSVPAIAEGEKNPATPAGEGGEEAAAANLQTFRNDEAGYTFQFASAQSINNDKGGLFVSTTDLGALGISEFMTSRAEPLKTNLAKGKVSQAAFSVPASNKLVRLNDGSYGQQYMVLGSIDVCSVYFSLSFEFYRDDRQVVMGYFERPENFQSLVSEYMTTDKKNCGDQPVWKEGGRDALYKALDAGTAPKLIQDWYDNFETVVKTVRVTR